MEKFHSLIVDVKREVDPDDVIEPKVKFLLISSSHHGNGKGVTIINDICQTYCRLSLKRKCIREMRNYTPLCSIFCAMVQQNGFCEWWCANRLGFLEVRLIVPQITRWIVYIQYVSFSFVIYVADTEAFTSKEVKFQLFFAL